MGLKRGGGTGPESAMRTWAVLFVMAALILPAGCSSKGKFSNPFARKFTPTRYPSDFAIVIDRNTDTYFSRVHVRQVIKASDMMSRTTYTTLSDYHNTVAARYTTRTPLSRAQLQAMWNAVRKHYLLQGAFTWTYWYSPIDRFQRNSMTLQIRANGVEKVYHQLNHWDNNKLPLILLCESVSLPIGQQVKPVEPTTIPAAGGTGPSSTRPAASSAAARKPAIVTPANRPAAKNSSPIMPAATKP